MDCIVVALLHWRLGRAYSISTPKFGWFFTGRVFFRWWRTNRREVELQIFAARETQGTELKSLAVPEPSQLSSNGEADGEVTEFPKRWVEFFKVVANWYNLSGTINQYNNQPGLRTLLRLNMAETIDRITWILLELPDYLPMQILLNTSWESYVTLHHRTHYSK